MIVLELIDLVLAVLIIGLLFVFIAALKDELKDP